MELPRLAGHCPLCDSVCLPRCGLPGIPLCDHIEAPPREHLVSYADSRPYYLPQGKDCQSVSLSFFNKTGMGIVRGNADFRGN